jgi:hypothetical protein
MPTEGQATSRAGVNGRAHATLRHLPCADSQRQETESVREPHPDASATDAGVDDMANRLIVEAPAVVIAEYRVDCRRARLQLRSAPGRNPAISAGLPKASGSAAAAAFAAHSRTAL